MGKYYIGADVGGTSVKMGLYDGIVDKFIKQWSIPTNVSNNGEGIIPDIADSIRFVCMERNMGIREITGIGACVPGPINREGLILKCANLGWGVFPIEAEMRKATGINNIVVENDANAAALGEMWKGGGQGFSDMVFVTLGTGIGGALILDGKIYSGYNGAAGEFGHATVEPEETEVCGCGSYGCLEQYASATGIVRLGKRALKNHSCNSEWAKGDFSAKDIVEAAKTGDMFALGVVEEFGRYLGTALSNVAHVVNPQAFVIAGGVSKGGQIIIDVVQKYYKKYAMYAMRDTEFKLAQLGSEAGVYGCVRLVV